ncbi:MAG TPA: hypothetical protein VMU37_10330 [Caulobacteraceae bacterium]|nr:hypothetical protein [Caulobacteraceae bacterium]
MKPLTLVAAGVVAVASLGIAVFTARSATFEGPGGALLNLTGGRRVTCNNANLADAAKRPENRE